MHYALASGSVDGIARELLRRGADLNSVDAKGSSPLHIICMRKYDYNSVKIFFKIAKKFNQLVQVDAWDELGRTPLQLAVANLKLDTIDVLLDHSADLSSFVFLDENYSRKRLEKWFYKLKLATGTLAVVERLQTKGYELDQSDALSIMNTFAKYGLFEISWDLFKYRFDDKKFTRKTKKIMIRPDLSLRDLIQQRPKEAAKLLTYKNCFACSHKLRDLRLCIIK
uniref:Uncharacterized protein n=1 Tax=Trichogramma kaykai TaxID=54128 RepID=A0ABD2XBT1_9HYME